LFSLFCTAVHNIIIMTSAIIDINFKGCKNISYSLIPILNFVRTCHARHCWCKHHTASLTRSFICYAMQNFLVH
jgi:hypothetical protein